MINHEKRFRQWIDFDWIVASDIDVCLEYDNKFLFLFELKYKGVDVPVWQQLLLSRIWHARESCWKKAFVFYCYHTTKAEKIINIFDCTINIIMLWEKKYEWNRSLFGILLRIAKKYDIKKLLQNLEKIKWQKN